MFPKGAADMSENQVKFKFRIGELEVEYEGIGSIPKEAILELSNSAQ